MKRLTLIAFVILASLAVRSQDEAEFNTIFGSDYSSGGYGAPELKLGKVNEDMSLLLGGRGGWIIGHKFVLGVAGYGMTTSNTFDYTEDVYGPTGQLVTDSTRNLKLDLGYGGILLEYIALPGKAIHLSFPVIIGAGGASIGSQINQAYTSGYQDPYAYYDYLESSAFFLVEPGIHVDMNMTRFFVLSAGASYRFISGTNLMRLDNTNLSGITFNLALKFGSF